MGLLVAQWFGCFPGDFGGSLFHPLFAGFLSLESLLQLFGLPLTGGHLFHGHGSLRIQSPSPGFRLPLVFGPGFVLLGVLYLVF